MKEAPEHPPQGPEAFASLEDPESVQAQAAILLAVGAQLRGDRAALQARSASAAQPADMLSRADLEEFPIPRLVPPGRRLSTSAGSVAIDELELKAMSCAGSDARAKRRIGIRPTMATTG